MPMPIQLQAVRIPETIDPASLTDTLVIPGVGGNFYQLQYRVQQIQVHRMNPHDPVQFAWSQWMPVSLNEPDGDEVMEVPRGH